MNLVCNFKQVCFQWCFEFNEVFLVWADMSLLCELERYLVYIQFSLLLTEVVKVYCTIFIGNLKKRKHAYQRELMTHAYWQLFLCL